ncbi:hypothetical protein H0H81_008804 [Sphagnurus paluster]|uniref:LysM domain-containing protein n=1 Tax=Sphagnurus paluster TaxID=117069 RepID=A0A9P7K759_9AGAR|nr:hypothetical protein H0H81_008804 [Sphagnurus paluster]
MGRWSQYDEDEYRLPEGMKRIGYDADTGRYMFQDRDGSVWQGAEGAEFSEMTRVSDGRAGASSQAHEDPDSDDIEAAPTRTDGYQALAIDPVRTSSGFEFEKDAYRTLFPFFLIVAVVLLLAWRLIVSPMLSSPPTSVCPKGTTGYWVQPGDTCWEIAKTHGCTLEQLRQVNAQTDCAALMPGMTMCLPTSETTLAS